MTKKIFLLLILFAALYSNIAAQTYSGGSGTESDPYLISSKADMIALATAVNGGTTYSGKYFLLTADISGITTCVGYQNQFSGTFDGNGHELDINNASGVFGTLSEATVKNLGVKGTVTNTTGTYAGGICSISDYSTITNCYNLANVTLSGSYFIYVGGICGSASGGSISYCYNLGNISGTGSSVPFVGGICGGYGNITNCFSANSSITAKNGGGNDNTYAGKINGGGGTVNNCYALSTMRINGATISSQNLYEKDGGDAPLSNFQSQAWITENLSWDVTNVWQMSSTSSINKGLPIFKTSITAPSGGVTTPTYSGGSGTQSDPHKISTKADMVALATAVNGGTTYSGKYFLLTADISGITTCVGYQNSFSGTFDGNGHELDITNASGVFGILDGATVKNLGVKGTVTNTYGTCAGGICSKISSSATSTITNCYNLANITVSDSYYIYVGGICGSASGGSISYCYNLGNISGTGSSVPFVGGICGGYGNITSCFSANSSITAKSGSSNVNIYAGRINGSGGTVNNCYALSTMTINGSTVSSQNLYEKDGVGAPLSNFQSQAWITTKLNWDFDNVWTMPSSSSVTQGLPILKWQVQNYSITASAGTNGSISLFGSVSVSQGGSQTYYFYPIPGYSINQVLVDGVANSSAKANGYYTFSNVTANHTISVSFAANHYALYFDAQSGTVSPTSITVTYGSQIGTLPTPTHSGYDFGGWFTSIGGSGIQYTSSTVYNTAGNTIVYAKWTTVPTYTITASAGTGGTISPSGSVSVNQGNSQTFTFTPNTGYEIDQVVVDGVNQGAISSYTFSNITANHTISVTFKQVTYTITATSGTNGSISPSGTVTVNYGDNLTYYISPNTGYEIDQVVVDGVNVGTVSNYTFTNITANHTISVTFKQITYTITATSDTNGSISPSGTATVNYGDNLTYYISPNTGYEIDQVVVNGVNQGAISSYTFSNITANHTISVTFKQVTYTITATSDTNGSILPGGTVTVNYGDNLTYYISPNTGYEIDQVRVDGVNQGAPSSYTFYNITANHSISVSFEKLCIPNLIVQIWDDVLSVINNPDNNGGYSFTEYQWQRNGEDIAGETQGNLYLNGDKAVAANYSCRMKTASGETVQTCEIFWSAADAASPISVYPNPATDLVTVESSEIKAGDKIGVYSTVGTLVRQMHAVEPNRATINLSALARGIYVVKVNGRQARVIKN